MKVANSTSTSDAANTILATGQSADSTQDTLTFAASNKWIVLDNASDDTIKIGHAKAGADKPTNAGEDKDAAPLFGQSFKTPYFKYDETGHVINHALRTVTLPIGSLTDKDVTNATSNVLTAIDFTPSTGAIFCASTAYVSVRSCNRNATNNNVLKPTSSILFNSLKL